MYSHMLRRARENSMSAWRGQRTLTNNWHFTDIKIGQFEQCEDCEELTRHQERKRERERMKDMGKNEYFNISSSGTEMHYICSSNQTSLWLGNLKSCQKEKTAPFTRFIANMNSGNVWDCNIFLYWCLKIWFTDSTQYMHKYCAVWFTINLDWDILCINLSVCSVKKKNWHFME